LGRSTEKTESTEKTLIVALWSVNTQGMQHLTLDSRWQALKQCVEHAYEQAMKQLCDLNDKPFALFVAPEYLMAQPDPIKMHMPPVPKHNFPGSRRHIDEADKNIQLQRYLALSDTCKGMILVPGTIAWRKSLERSGPKQTSTKTGKAKTRSRYDKAIESLQFYQQRRGWGPDEHLSGPWKLSELGLGPDIPAPTTREKLAALQGAQTWNPVVADFGLLHGPNDLVYMARNTAYVLLDGKVLLKYNKQGDFHEVLVGTDTVHIPGKLDGRFQVTPTKPNLRTIDFGLEICLDHIYQTTGTEIAHLGKVDVHIISSAQVPTNKAKAAAADAGYVVHACSNKANTGVKRMSGGGWFGGKGDLKPFKTEDVEGFPLQLWQIELDLTPLSGTVEPSTKPWRTVF
jgi:hypothetical protein